MKYESDFNVQSRPQIQVLSEHQRHKLHRATLEVLEQTGVRVFEPETRELLKDKGANIHDESLVKIPSNLVKKALQSTPERVVIKDRNGEESMVLEGHNVYFGTGSDLQHTIDPFSKDRKKTIKSDIGSAALISDYLDNIDFVMSMGIASDVDESTADLHHFEEMVSNTTKPIIFTALNLQRLKEIYQMSVEIKGSSAKLGQDPFIIHYSEPSTPLRHSSEALEKLLFCSKKKLPLIYVSGPAMGASAPVTVAGAAVLSMAEFLSGLVISQLKNEGAPVICGGGSSPLDMKTSAFSYAAPENWLNEIVIKEMSSFYGLPIFGEGGVSDAKTFDQQAAYENAVTLILTGLGGTNLIHDIGYLESGFTASYESILFGNEVIGALKRFLEGVEVDKESLATEVINKVGPGGDFLTAKHTMDNFKEKIWEPRFLDRHNYEGWQESGAKKLGKVLNEKVKRILNDHQPKPLEEQTKNRICQIIKEAENRDDR